MKLSIHTPAKSAVCPLPLYMEAIPAGFPSPAEGEVETSLDLNTHLVKRPEATFFVRVQGDSMEGAQIYSGDTLIVDRSIRPKSGDIVVAILNGEFTVKRVRKEGRQISLIAENDAYPPIQVTKGSEFQVWGVVTYVIHKAR